MSFLSRISLPGARSVRPLLAAQHAGLWAAASIPHRQVLCRRLSNEQEQAREAGEVGAEYGQMQHGDEPLANIRPVASRGEQGVVLRSGRPDNWQRQLAYEWLRDSCRCQLCVNQDTLQRNLHISSALSNTVPDTLTDGKDGIKITWSDGHKSSYSWDMLKRAMRMRPDFSGPQGPSSSNSEYELWGREMADHPPSVAFDRVMAGDDSGLAELTAKLRQYGFAIVDDTPFDDPGHTKSLLERIAFIRVTHYGGFYDFTPDMSVADTAYTNAALPAHTDTTYFTDPAGLQAFHLLSHRAGPGSVEPSGGASLLVDGFRAADILRDRDVGLFRALVQKPVCWHASGNVGNVIAPSTPSPVLELGRDLVQRVRWNNADRGVFYDDVGPSIRDWYRAARAWEDILQSEDSECWIQLVPGKVLIFDNWRVLHGRSAFTGTRRICGGYINRDDWVARWRGLHMGREQAVEEAIGLRPSTF